MTVPRIGVMVPTYDGTEQPGHLRRLAELAEELGLDDLWVPDHLVFPVDLPDALTTAATCIGATRIVLSTADRPDEAWPVVAELRRELHGAQR